jgi:hypothetical protein
LCYHSFICSGYVKRKLSILKTECVKRNPKPDLNSGALAKNFHIQLENFAIPTGLNIVMIIAVENL